MRDRGIVLDRSSGTPLHRQLESAIREAILSGRLKPGERILSSRELQTHLGLSRNTIVTALDQLYAEGYLISVRGVGTFVTEALVNRTRVSEMPEPEKPLVPTPAASAFLAAQDLAGNFTGNAPFRPGVPALDLFPSVQFRRALNARAWNAQALGYPSACGDERLREAIGRRLQQTRGVACTPEQIFIVGGAQAAFSLIARVLLKRGDHVVVEEPGYPNVRAVLLAQGARLLTAPVDADGVDIGPLMRRRAAFMHMTPSHQYPTGAVLTLERRFAVLEWAAKHDAWIVEDDYDSEFTYTRNPQPALHGLDGGRRVLYVGTFSKVLSPALRVAYIVVPKALHSAFQAAQQVIGDQPSTILQSALAAFMENGQFSRHIFRMRAVYDERRRFAHAEFRRRFQSAVQIQDSGAGLHFTVHLPRDVDDAKFSERALEAGVIVPPLSKYFVGRPTLNGILIGYAGSAPAIAKQAITQLAHVYAALRRA